MATLGKIAPPRKPAPIEIARQTALATTTSARTPAEPSAAIAGSEVCPEKSTRSTGLSLAARKATAIAPTASPPASSAAVGRAETDRSTRFAMGRASAAATPTSSATARLHATSGRRTEG